MQIKYVFQRGDTLYWQRRVPKDLEDRYGSSALLKVNLKTNDLNRAAKMVERLNQQHEAFWEYMRGNQTITPANIREQALMLLRRHNLTPYPAENDPAEVENFIATIFEDKKEKMALASDDPETAYRELGRSGHEQELRGRLHSQGSQGVDGEDSDYRVSADSHS